MQTAIPATLMRGGTSKGLYFDKSVLPTENIVRDSVLLAAMGSPDIRQIDGIGGGHPLTSKVAIISKSNRDDADVDYLFLQVVVDQRQVSDSQNCGNILAGVGPWAIENQFVDVAGETTPVRIHMVNTGSIAIAHVSTPGGNVEYDGDAVIDGVPGTAAAIPIDFVDVAGSSCGTLLPTGSPRNVVDGIEVTCIDNGMPVVILRARDFGLTGLEVPEIIEANSELKEKIEKIRLAIGPKMNLGDVVKKTVPKMTLVSPPMAGGVISTRSFIPHRVHEAIGVLGAVSVATACVVPGSVTEGMAKLDSEGLGIRRLSIEHPTGFFTVDMDTKLDGDELVVQRSALLRTARQLMRGEIFVPSSVWDGT